MKFLMLHGFGTNSKVFEMQTAALRFELGNQHTFEFVEGNYECPPAPGLQDLFPTEEFFGYYDWRSAASMTTALSELSDYIATEGPFDAVLGFSQGAALAATLLAQPASTPPPFRFAVFICGAIPGDSSVLRGGNLCALDPISDAGAIKIPTAHILGKKDPVRHESVVLRDVCDEKGKRVFEFEGGHEVPRGRESKEMVAVIRDVLDGVMFAQ